MIDMPEAQSIRSMFQQGYRVAEIAKTMKISEPTVRKYIKMEDFNQPVPGSVTKPSILDPYKDTIIEYLEEDGRNWYKQRHTGKRVFERLVDEEGYKGSYPTVQRFIRKLKVETGPDAFLDLVWAPAEAQCDFGEADFNILGKKVRMHYLVLVFPYSNVGFAQVFYGENAECVCEGLKRIFLFVKGIPLRIIFDNGVGIGKKICEEIRLTEVFCRFQMHYNFAFSFTSINSGHEKGAVENKVGALRRSLFVPIPEINDLDEYNIGLLQDCVKHSDSLHYRKGERCLALFEEDCCAMTELPQTGFEVVRYESFKTNKKAEVVVGGKHYYSTGPEFARTFVTLGFHAYDVCIYDDTGSLIAKHPRLYGDTPAESIDPAASLRLLISRPGGWINSQVRYSLPEDLRDYIDAGERADIRSYVKTLAEAVEVSDWQCAVEAAWSVYRSTGHIARSDVAMYARRLYDGDVIYGGTDVDLSTYDKVFAAMNEVCNCEEMCF